MTHPPVKIPKIIHQIWMKPDEITDELLSISKTWRDLNPDWEYRLWNRTSAESLLEEHYPDLLPAHKAYLCEEQRVNAVSYLILHTFGGLYVDMDSECLEPIDRLIGNSECFLGLTLPEESMFCGNPTLPVKYFMGCTANHDYFERIIEGMVAFENKLKISYIPYLTEISTGGLLLANTLSRYADKDKITLIPAEYVNPLSESEIRMAMCGTATPEIEQKVEAAFVIKYKLYT